MEQQAITQLFLRYIDAFNHYDLSALAPCYSLPCTLHTPDKVSMLMTTADFEKEFIAIFTVLQQGNVQQLIATKAHYTPINTYISAVCIDWAFIDDKAQVFADFSAFYHVVAQENQLKIINVVSHELDNVAELTHALPELIK